MQGRRQGCFSRGPHPASAPQQSNSPGSLPERPAQQPLSQRGRQMRGLGEGTCAVVCQRLVSCQRLVKSYQHIITITSTSILGVCVCLCVCVPLSGTLSLFLALNFSLFLSLPLSLSLSSLSSPCLSLRLCLCVCGIVCGRAYSHLQLSLCERICGCLCMCVGAAVYV